LLLPCCLQDFVDVRELTREEEVAKGLDLLTRLHGVAGRGKEYVLKELSDFGLAGRSGSDAQLLKQLAGKFATEKLGQSATADLVRRVSKLPSWEAVCEMCRPADGADCAGGADGADGATAGSGAGSPPPSAPANAAEPSTAPFLPKGCQVAFKFSTGWAVGVVKEVLRDGEKRTRVVAYACTSGSDSSVRPSGNGNSSGNGNGRSTLGSMASDVRGAVGLGSASGSRFASRNFSSTDLVQEFPDAKLVPAEDFAGFRFGGVVAGGSSGPQPELQPQDPYPEKVWARVVSAQRRRAGTLQAAKAGLSRVTSAARGAVSAVSKRGGSR
jgi:hypothetical protein